MYISAMLELNAPHATSVSLRGDGITVKTVRVGDSNTSEWYAVTFDASDTPEERRAMWVRVLLLVAGVKEG